MSFASTFATCALLLAVSGLSPGSALAQPLGSVVVVPFSVDGSAETLTVAATVEAELSNEHASVIPFHDARDRFFARSRSPLEASESDVDILAREAHEAIEHVAFGRTAAAQKSVRQVITRAERTLESLNRETSSARQLLDACLALVRSALQSDKRDLALEQATRCRRLVPDLAPSEVAHPANVIGVLAEADNLLRRMRIGNLTVRSEPRSGCSVYLNGRHLGTTPFQLDRAAAGDYRVQVECGRSPGRVHVVQLGDQPVSLLVDARFDAAVATDPRLSLRYDSRDEQKEHAVAHAAQLGHDVLADDVVLLGIAQDHVELLRVRVGQQRLVARASAPWSSARGVALPQLRRALTALAEGRLDEEAASFETPARSEPPATTAVATDTQVVEVQIPAAADPPITPLSAPRPRARHWQRWLGASVLTLGVGAWVFTGVASGKRAARGQDLKSTSTDDAPSSKALYGAAFADWNDARSLPYVLAATGSALTTAGSLVLLLSVRRQAFPWWASVASAAAGVGLAAWGISDVASGTPCDTGRADVRKCVDPQEQLDRGALLVLASAPFLALPITQLFRALTDEPEHSPTVTLVPSARSLVLRAQLDWL